VLRGGGIFVKNPFATFLEGQGVVVLDGGLATTLESYGFDLDDPLWSARVLLEAPHAVRRAHGEFLRAGADCIATATYQATHAGLAARGLSRAAADEVFHRAARLAIGAREDFWSDPAHRAGRLRPLVAGSIGPYGAYLADGSEYTGDYGLSEGELRDFHEDRWRILAESGVDLLACETIPSGAETRALLGLLAETPDVWAWVSFSCRDGAHLADGTPLAEAAQECRRADRVAALGVNCVPPSRVSELISGLVAEGGPPVAAYPNSGEVYDAAAKTWSPGEATGGLSAAVDTWIGQGAQVVGGCCRVGPAEIRSVRSAALG
jgi:homocysteine S-methyltransferase